MSERDEAQRPAAVPPSDAVMWTETDEGARSATPGSLAEAALARQMASEYADYKHGNCLGDECEDALQARALIRHAATIEAALRNEGGNGERA